MKGESQTWRDYLIELAEAQLQAWDREAALKQFDDALKDEEFESEEERDEWISELFVEVADDFGLEYDDQV